MLESQIDQRYISTRIVEKRSFFLQDLLQQGSSAGFPIEIDEFSPNPLETYAYYHVYYQTDTDRTHVYIDAIWIGE